MLYPDDFLSYALPMSSNWNASTKRLVAPSPAASRPPLSHFYSPRLLYLPFESPWLISLFYIMSGLIVSQLHFLFQVWPKMEWNQDSADRPGKFLRPLKRLCFLLRLPGRLFLLALLLAALFLLETCLAHLDSFPLHDLLLWQTAMFLFFLSRAALAYLPTALSGTEATLFFSAGPVCSSFSAEACAIRMLFAGLGSTNKSATSPIIWLLFCPRHSVLSSIFALTSISQDGRTETVFSLFLFYQATMGPRTFVSPGKRRGWWAGQTGSDTRALCNPL